MCMKMIRVISVFILSALVTITGCGKQNIVTLSGTVESTQIDINSEVPGKIIVIHKEEGAEVKKDEIAATVDSSAQKLMVKQQAASLKSAMAKLDLLKNGSTSQAIKAAEANVEQLQAAYDLAELTLSKYDIRSPVSGTFIYKNVEVGDIIMPGGSIGTVSDLSDLWVALYVPERYINNLALGLELKLSSISLSNTPIKGKIIYIADKAEFTPKNTETPEAKENTVFKIKVKILDNIQKLRPGMTIDANIPVGGVR